MTFRSRLRGSRVPRGATATLLLLLTACRADTPRQVELTGPTMGTTWKVTIVPGPDGLPAEQRLAIDGAIRDTLTRIEGLMSTWDPDSELSRFNRAASTEPFPVAPETFDVFRWAVKLGEETGGALDVTVWPIVEAWGFGATDKPDGAVPQPEELSRLLEATGIGQLELDPAGRWIRKRHPGVQCDFSAVAPGYAADRVTGLLTGRGLAHVLVDVGGELAARGRNAEGVAWQIAVEQPREGRRRSARMVPLADAAIATSGDYRNYREVGGTRVSHIIDPRTGRPVTHALASATVIDALGVRADGLATALMVLGPDDGMALARRLDLAAMFIVRRPDGGFDIRTTPRFDEVTRTE